MKTLPTQFHKRGFSFKQIERKNGFAIYSKFKLNTKILSYEVIEILSHNGYTLGNTEIPASETFPSSEQWGIKGWTYDDLTAAKKKFLDLTDKTANVEEIEIL